jgi:hypothetical protein
VSLNRGVSLNKQYMKIHIGYQKLPKSYLFLENQLKCLLRLLVKLNRDFLALSEYMKDKGP